ncbi:MAG: BlaI/MecI/CopY family transcriptional regulator [Oscillospiraceae bacterium]|jgi:BlaI family penicillinase repressor|nr:BlaI/MecI/CopY family transcriptional regulator [Oscillospiraceae bacterium]
MVKPITDAELEIMKILWRENRPLSFKEIRTELEVGTDWNKSTIQTLLRRLCEKGSVAAQEHYVVLYTANVSREEYVRAEVPAFLDRVFDGSAMKLVAALRRGGTLSDGDIAELRAFFKAEGGEQDE